VALPDYHPGCGGFQLIALALSLSRRSPTDFGHTQIISALEPHLIATASPPDALRRRLAERKRILPLLQEAVERAEHLLDEQHYFSATGDAELASARENVEVRRRTFAQATESLREAERLEALERESDDFAAHMSALLRHGETVGLQDEHCPLCDAVRESEDFAVAIERARRRLADRGARVERAVAALAAARSVVAHAEQELKTAQQLVLSLEQRRVALENGLRSVEAIFTEFHIDALPLNLDVARRQILQKREEAARLERAILILETSGAHDRVTALETRVSQLKSQVDIESTRLAAADRAIELARQIDASAKAVANQMLTEQFDTVMPLLKELFWRLRPHTEWREIESDFGGRVRASLNCTVGEGRNPQFLFSSGQRRAAGIAFLLAIHLSRPWCRWRSLLLDDPVQHIDDYRALNLVEVLSAVRRTGRQIIVTVEDPSLADVLCRRLRATTKESGRRFELAMSKNGSAVISEQHHVYPLPREILRDAEVS
jgi:chromosome segregation protein